MTIGYAYALLGLLCFGALGLLHKLADVKQCRPSALSVLLYGWSLLLVTVALAGWQGESLRAPSTVVLLALPFGMVASIAILALQSALPHGHIATSWLVINLSAVVPTIASIVIYDESVNPKKAAALALVAAAMGLLWKDKTVQEGRPR